VESAIDAAEAVAMHNLPVPIPEPVDVPGPLPSPPRRSSPQADHHLSSPRLRDVEAGHRFTPRVYRLSRGDLVNYAGVSGDNNPIHWSDNVTRTAGMSNVVAHGMLTMGLGAGYLTTSLDDPRYITEYAVHFSRPVFVDPQHPTDLEFTGVVQAVDHRNRTAVIALTAQSEGERIFGRSTATVQLA
jgi:acyl dehydratase